MPQTLSRRRLLHLVGATAGSTAAYQAAIGLGLMADAQAVARPDVAPPGKDAKRVVILGAGIAGLTAAYELSRKGYECTLLEASHRAGGRNLTLRHGDIVDEIGNPQTCQFDPDPDLFFNAGPARIPAITRRCSITARSSASSSRPSSTRTATPGCEDDAAFAGRPVRNREYVTDARGFLRRARHEVRRRGSSRCSGNAGRRRASHGIPARLRRSELSRTST